MSKVKYVNNFQSFVNSTDNVMEGAIARMSKDTGTIAKIRIPFKGGDLQKSEEQIKVSKLHMKVLFNEEYASYQERGERKDGSRKVRKYSTPGTGKDFLKEAGEKVGRDAVNYFKQAANLAKA